MQHRTIFYVRLLHIPVVSLSMS